MQWSKDYIILKAASGKKQKPPLKGLGMVEGGEGRSNVALHILKVNHWKKKKKKKQEKTSLIQIQAT